MISFAIEAMPQYNYLPSFENISRIEEKFDRSKPTNYSEIKTKEKTISYTSASEDSESENKVSTLTSNIAESKLSLHTNNYTDSYLKFNISNLTEGIISEVSEWEKVGTLDGLMHISNIKDLLLEYQSYYSQKSESRIFFSLINLIFESNIWAKMNSSQIKLLKVELKRYENGTATEKDVKKFINQLYREDLFSLSKFADEE